MFSSNTSSAEGGCSRLLTHELHMMDFVPVETVPEVRRMLKDTPLENIMID